MTTTPDKIVEAITEHYLETGDLADTQKIATRLGVSVNTVRKHLREDAQRFLPEGIYETKESRTSYGKNYGEARGSHLVSVYGPTLEALRQIVLKLRKPGVAADSPSQ